MNLDDEIKEIERLSVEALQSAPPSGADVLAIVRRVSAVLLFVTNEQEMIRSLAESTRALEAARQMALAILRCRHDEHTEEDDLQVRCLMCGASRARSTVPVFEDPAKPELLVPTWEAPPELVVRLAHLLVGLPASDAWVRQKRQKTT